MWWVEYYPHLFSAPRLNNKNHPEINAYVIGNCGLKATPQRLCILKVLAHHEHPSIEKLYEDIKKDYPSISLATVYKNINTLLDEGVVVEVNAPNQKSRFDIYEKPHIHVVCEKCGSIEDLGMDDDTLIKAKEEFERKARNIIKKFNVVATVSDCECCR